MSHTVTTWYLEQTSPADLSAAAEPDPAEGLRIVRAEVPSPEYSRFLYAAVGADVSWTDRLGWSREQWLTYLSEPGTQTWVAYSHGTPAGYIELKARPDGRTEIAYFGLLPAFRGRRIGGHLLTYGTARAWEPTGTRQVWVHTCSLDGPHALANYEKRGFRIYDTKVGDEEEKPIEGSPWTSSESGR
jgi:ribosomal protein S18 acetylase RimI-like enzyme